MNQTALKKAALTWLPEAAAVILAVIALRKGNPYGYYVFLRWVVCPIFGWIVWKSYSRGFGLIKTNIVQMHDEQRNWQDVSASELKATTAEALQSVVTISTNSELPTDLPTGQVVTTAPIITPKEESTPATLPNTDPPNLTGLSQHDRANHDQVAPSSKTPDQTLPKTEKRWWNLFSGR